MARRNGRLLEHEPAHLLGALLRDERGHVRAQRVSDEDEGSTPEVIELRQGMVTEGG